MAEYGEQHLDKIRVIIADDHPVVRRGTCQLLQQEPDLEVAGVHQVSPQVLQSGAREMSGVTR